MMFYLRLGKLFAIHFEGARALTAQPLIDIESYNGEIIFDMPYSRLIFTPGHKFNPKMDTILYDEGNPHFSGRTSRVAED